MFDGNAVQFKFNVGLVFYKIIQCQLIFARITEADNDFFRLDNNKIPSFIIEQNGKQELYITVEADLYPHNINTRAASINAGFKNETQAKKDGCSILKK